MNKTIFETKRLFLREFNIEDARHLYNLNADHEVIKYTGDSAFQSVEDAKSFLSNYNQYQLYGMGRWAVCLKSTHEFIGWCGLKFHLNEKLVEVGYRFFRKHWNQGYAAESAMACINYGFETFKLKEIYAHAHIDNTASHKVIEKCGMVFINEAIYDNMPAKLYKTINPYYQLKKITAEETYSVRHPVLRAGRPLSDCAFDGDLDDNTFHIGLFFKNTLVGVASYLKNSSTLFLENEEYQLRGMAVLQEYQKKGLGELILSEGEKLLKNTCDRIWCNARQIAVNFYTENGFQIFGEPFEIKNIGLHYVMSKKLI